MEVKINIKIKVKVKNKLLKAEKKKKKKKDGKQMQIDEKFALTSTAEIVHFYIINTFCMCSHINNIDVDYQHIKTQAIIETKFHNVH